MLYTNPGSGYSLRNINTSFKNSDAELALEAAAKARDISKRCESIIAKLVESDYSAAQAVVLTLGARYLKRIALHLANIASSIFLPLPEMNYINTKFRIVKEKYNHIAIIYSNPYLNQ